MNRSLSKVEPVLYVLMGAIMASGIAILAKIGEAPTPAECAPPVVLQVDLQRVPARDEVMYVRPWPNPNECGIEVSETPETLPPRWVYETDLPTLRPDTPASNLTEL